MVLQAMQGVMPESEQGLSSEHCQGVFSKQKQREERLWTLEAEGSEALGKL